MNKVSEVPSVKNISEKMLFILSLIDTEFSLRTSRQFPKKNH